MKTIALAALTIAAAVTACGPSTPEGSAATPASGAPAGWNALDACATLDKAKVAAAAGGEVTEASLSGVTDSTPPMADLSTCLYTLAGGTTIGVLTRESPDGDATDAAIASARTMGGVMPPATDIPGLGRAALWSKDLNSLQVFLDDKRYVAINIMTPAPGTDPQATATAVAKALL